ncbi:MAG: sigma 54-interacting transcriptional regulator [Acidobacteria bacterium]|nr:sigma 54-interacting transcriptional regulator [Acidobacteriota bacterium]
MSQSCGDSEDSLGTGREQSREDTTRNIQGVEGSGREQASTVLRLISGPDAGREFPLLPASPVVRVGREPDNDLVLSDPTASRHHIEILQRPEGHLLRDLSSTNGTLLDGLRVREAFVPPNACVRVGTTDIKFVSAQHGEEPAPEFAGLYGQSEKMREVFRLISKVASTPLTALITGETGTGKELVARAIHKLSPRADAPFIVFDCSAVPEELMENELYGHQKGAFTGAMNMKKGIFELADEGTVFLDEVGELSMQQQPKLLRFLERQEVRRLGSTQGLTVDVRVIAATNRYLDEEMQAGRFREDLFYRVSVIQIHLPPLRERPEDVPLLVQHFLQHRLPREHLKQFSGEAMTFLTEYEWPGNVRELRHLVDRAVLLSPGDTIESADLTALLYGASRRPAGDGTLLADLEKTAILRSIQDCGGNKVAAAKRLGISASTLYEKLKRFGRTD